MNIVKKFFSQLIVIFSVCTAYGQVAINTDGSNANASAMLDISSTEAGLLIPRMTKIQRDNIENPVQGLMIFQTNNTPGFYHWDGSSWTLFGMKNASWGIDGNSATVAATNFIGTNDEQDLTFRTNNVEKLRLTQKGQLEILNTGGSVFIGSGAGSRDLLNNNYNVFIGEKAGAKNTSGGANTAIGYYSYYNSILGYFNTTYGYMSLYHNTLGWYNTAGGTFSLFSNTTANGNTANGFQALYFNTTGYANVAVGITSLYNNTDRSYLVAVGDSALYNNGSGVLSPEEATQNTAIGSKAMYENTRGFHATALGFQALYNNTTGFSNVALGANALFSNTIRSNLVAIGDSAMYNNGTGVFGSEEASRNTAVGSKAGLANTRGYNITAVGYESLYSNTTAYSIVAIGANALHENTTRPNLVAVGDSALFNNGTGANFFSDATNNTAIGSRSMVRNETGVNNSAIGYQSLYSNTTGDNNTAFGTFALYHTTEGDYNTGIGNEAIFFNTTGYGNTACGWDALMMNATGYENTALGKFAFYTGDNYHNSTALGYNAHISADNMVKLGNADVTWIGGYSAWQVASDGRFKRNIRENVAGLEFIMKLRPVTYNLDLTALESFAGIPDSIAVRSVDRLKNEQIIHTGFIAQEVEKAARETGFEFDGVHHPAGENDPYSLAYAEFVVPLVKAIQEQQQMIDKQMKMIEELQTEVAVLKNKQ